MQRSKAAVSVEVKRVIGALCRLLAAAGLDHVPAPEAFRRAKFGGGPEEEDQFWQLLSSLLQTTGIVSSSQLTERRQLVAAGLWQTGFHAAWMYVEAGEAGGGGSSSRDLLLALGWLLAAGTLEDLVAQRVQQLDQTLLWPAAVKAEFSGEFQPDSASLRRLQWLVGNLRHQGRTLLSATDERTRTLHAVLTASLSSSPGRSSAALQEDCVRVRQLSDLLEAYLSWKQVEKVFWTWMDSVMDGHLADPDDMRSSRAPSEVPKVCHHGDRRGLEKLDEVLVRLQGTQRGSRGCVDPRGGAASPPEGRGASSLPSIPRVCRARLQPEGPLRPGVDHPCSGVDAPDELPASRAAELLRDAEAELLQRRDRRRLVSRMQLQDAIAQLEELVLIPL
ncbi:tubulin epsilon and delta complex protein 1 [Odontesthes bonariensis]|uniref:tubulin epsilon and delta complex protein 1 n=1 Tax=Odontesthes bonariensis TaxID=219752 RepID=UPI003F58A2A8